MAGGECLRIAALWGLFWTWIARSTTVIGFAVE